ncbi:MAG TPA: SRPBCC family protein [Gaiellaceae bacterium]|nr:SRPBCC family protein [Gaiellaceae bacterium]
MPTARAERELLAPLEDVWRFLAEPHHLADWWPGLAAVRPDRRGLAPGARWQVRTREASLLRRAEDEDTLLVHEVRAPELLAFELVRARIRAALTLAPAGRGRTRARLEVRGPLLLAFARSLPKEALARLHALCRTAETA